MADAVKRFGRFLGLVEDDPGFEDVVAEPTPVRTLPNRVQPEVDQYQRPTPLRPVTAPVEPPSNRQVVTCTPHSFNDAAQIGKDFRNGHPVMMNLDEVDPAVARRLIDFASGMVMALEGRLSKISASVVVLLPRGMDISPAERQNLVGGHFFNQD